MATIRRTPSTKPAVRRCGSVPGAGPIHARTPMVPALIPTVPDLPRLGPALIPTVPDLPRLGPARREEESPLSPGREGLPVAGWSGQASTNPPSCSSPPGPAAREEEWGEGEELLEGGGAEQQEEGEEGGSMLAAIRKGVKLKRTPTNDRSAPRMA